MRTCRNCPSQWIEHEHGLGRFRTIERREYDETIRVIEPVWTDSFGTMSWERARLRKMPVDSLEVIDIDYDARGGRMLALVYERRPARRTEDARLALLAADGVGLPQSWDLPEDETADWPTNPYVDLDVAADSRVYVFDDYSDRVLAFAADGVPEAAIPVAADVRRIAADDRGRVFGLREPGYVERYDPDGSIGARFDGRPNPAGDPLALSAIEVTAAIRDTIEAAFLESLTLPPGRFVPGSVVPVTVELRDYRGRRWEHRVDFRLPESLAPGTYTLLACDGKRDGAAEAERAPGRFDPQSLDHLMELLAGGTPQDMLVLRLLGAGGDPVVAGRELAGLPPSLRRALVSAPAGGRVTRTVASVEQLQLVDMGRVVLGCQGLSLTVEPSR